MSATPEVNKQTMMYYTALFAALLSAFVGAKEIIDPSKCAAELQGALFEPQTYAKDYMQKVAANFKIGSALLFSPNANSYINSFENEWGVTISVSEASNICGGRVGSCQSSFQSFDQVEDEYEITINEDFIFDTITVEVSGNYQTDSTGFAGFTLINPAGDELSLSDYLCASTSYAASTTFSITFADGGGVLNCAELDSTTSPLAPTQPLSTFSGQNILGTWGLRVDASPDILFTGLRLTFCQLSNVCSRDVMKALTNIPGYRFDSTAGMVYYTEDIFDAFGNFKQVTISRPIDGIYLKK